MISNVSESISRKVADVFINEYFLIQEVDKQLFFTLV